MAVPKKKIEGDEALGRTAKARADHSEVGVGGEGER